MARVWPWSRLLKPFLVSSFLNYKQWRCLPLGMLSVACTTFSFSPGPVSAQDIIRCPDWKLLVNPAVLRSRSEQVKGESFDAALQMARPVRPIRASISTTATGQAGGKQQAQTPAKCTYIVKSGDTLGKIAARFLGASNRWPEIARANAGVDSRHLRIGTVINLPCAAPAGQGTAARNSGGPLAGTGFLVGLSGQKKTPAASNGQKTAKAATATAQIDSGKKKTAPATAQNDSGKKKAAPAPQPAKPAPPTPAPLPIWSAKAGEDFATVLNRWGKAAKYQIVIRTTDAWTIGVPIRLQTDFESAVAELVKGLGSDGRSPPVRVYKNKVIRLGGL